MKTKHLFIAVIALSLVAITSCSKDNDPIAPVNPSTPVIDTKPVFKVAKEKVYYFHFSGYDNNILDYYYYNNIVTQTNPKATVLEATLKHMSDSINNKCEYRNSMLYYYGFGVELNGSPTTEFNLGVMFSKKGGNTYVDINTNKDLLEFGRDSILHNLKKMQFLYLYTTFEPNRILATTSFREYKTKGEFGDVVDYIACAPISINNNSSQYAISLDMLKLTRPKEQPDININEWNIAYHRFNGRKYTDKDGNVYVTQFNIKKATEMLNFDPNVGTLGTNTINNTSLYPTVLITKNGEPWFEGVLSKTTEENSVFEDGTKQIDIEFRIHTFMSGLWYEIQTESYYNISFVKRCLDFSKPSSGANFTTVSSETIYMVSDELDGQPSVQQKF